MSFENKERYFKQFLSENIGKDPRTISKEYLKLNSCVFANIDIDVLQILFNSNPGYAYIICHEIIKSNAYYDVFYFWSILKRCNSSLERNAAIGILLNRAFDAENGNLENSLELITKKYAFAKSQYLNSGYSLGNLCNEILPPSDKFVIVDGGAMRTDMHQVFSNVPRSRLQVYAFEPFPEFAKIERERFKNCDLDIKILEIGLWHEKDTKKISSWGSPSLFPREEKFGDHTVNPSIELDSLNNMFRENKWKSIDFLKLNIEGSELSALKGSTDYLDRIQAVKTEVKFFHSNKNHPMYFEICEFLHHWGYRLFEIARPVFAYPPGYTDIHQEYVYLKDSWITPTPGEAHWLFIKDAGEVNLSGLLKRVIALEAFGKIPEAMRIINILLETQKIPKALPVAGNTASYIQKIDNIYRNLLEKRKF